LPEKDHKKEPKGALKKALKSIKKCLEKRPQKRKIRLAFSAVFLANIPIWRYNNNVVNNTF
jgi:hypothetical protein